MVCATAIVTACGSSSSGGTSAITSDAGAGDAATGTGTVSVLVVAPVITSGGRADTALPGATVSIDEPGGGHQDATTDANGMVTFSGIDWSLGNASLVGSSSGRAAYGVADVGPGNFKGIPNEGKADVVLYLFEPSTKGRVTLTTTWQNKAAASDYVFVGATTGSGEVDNNQAAATLSIGSDAPYTLVAQEFTAGAGVARQINISTVRWASFDEPQPTNTTVALSLDIATGGTTLTPTTSHVHAVVPGGQTGPLTGCAFYTNVTSKESNLGGLFGDIVQSTVGTDLASFDATVESVSVPGQTLYTQYELAVGTTVPAASSVVTVVGAPQDGASISTFLTPIVPKSSSISMSQPFDVSGSDPAAVTRLLVVDATGNLALLVDAPPGTSTMHFPTLPDALKASVQAGKSRIITLADSDPVTFDYLREATSKLFSLTP